MIWMNTSGNWRKRTIGEIKDNEAYQKALFEEYVLRGSEHWKKREELNRLYQAGGGIVWRKRPAETIGSL